MRTLRTDSVGAQMVNSTSVSHTEWPYAQPKYPGRNRSEDTADSGPESRSRHRDQCTRDAVLDVHATRPGEPPGIRCANRFAGPNPRKIKRARSPPRGD